MRFRWCGDADCPDWVLAEMATLSRLSSVKLKLLATLVAQAVTEPPFNMEKAEKLFTDSKLESGCDELRGCVSCVAWIMRSATRAGCDAAALGGELQQLGLPREHAHALRRVYTDHVAAIRAQLYQQSLRESGCDELRGCVSCVAWIMRSATRAGCDAAALGGELQQLGLPREHAHALRRVYTDHVAAIRAQLYQQSLRVNPLSKATFHSLPSTDLVEMELATGQGGDTEKRRVLVPRALLETVVQDLKTAHTTMEELSAFDHAL